MTYYVPAVGTGLRVGNHNPDVPYLTIHRADCAFLPEGTTDFDALVEEKGEHSARRRIRAHMWAACAFCQPSPLIEGKAPQERDHEAMLARDARMCGCGHRSVSHSTAEPHPCLMEERNDWDEDVRCECTSFEEVVQVTSEPLRSPNPDDLILPGAFQPGPVPVRFPDGKVVEGHVDADGRVTVTVPGHLLIREDDQFTFGPRV